MDDSTTPRRQTGFLLQPLDDEMLLYHPEQTKAIYMNASATVIWGLCDGEATVTEITRLLQEAFPEAAERMPDDVRATLQVFAQHGAIDAV
jgi:hypothetical protein